MRFLNIFTLSEVCTNFSEEDYKLYFDVYGTELKEHEITDLSLLIYKLDSATNNKKIFDMFYVGYKIPQIGKEFDLIRIGQNSLINIEIKSKSTVEKIKKQLTRNKYYLNHIEKENSYYTFESSTSTLFTLSDNGEVEEVSINELITKLESQDLEYNDHLDRF